MPALAIVDPISTGACVAVEATQRGYTVIALWSRDSPHDLRDFVPLHAKSLKYHANVEEADTLAATASALRAVVHDGVIDAVICGCDTGVCSYGLKTAFFPRNGL